MLDKVEVERPDETIANVVEGARIPLAVADLDVADAPLCQVNDAFTELTGFPASTAVGRNCRFLQGRNPASEAQREPIRSAVRSFSENRGVILNYHANGRPFANYLLLFPLKSFSNRRLMLGSQFDVTERLSKGDVDDRFRQMGELVAPLLHDEWSNVFIQNLTVLSRSVHSLIESRSLTQMLEERFGEAD